ncbi:hypothetical protein KUTeg_021305 [Tegillarca granosa]|uniref:LRR containing protein n=1 Tax=Tegillarca granosa TaxID=220873 RepID=A0ABQ9EAF4_TEGGR|nr:hypothetical protein KUTeg_021305 [Tegillarca granosa]
MSLFLLIISDVEVKKSCSFHYITLKKKRINNISSILDYLKYDLSEVLVCMSKVIFKENINIYPLNHRTLEFQLLTQVFTVTLPEIEFSKHLKVLILKNCRDFVPIGQVFCVQISFPVNVCCVT